MIHQHHVGSMLAEDTSSPCDVVHSLSEEQHWELQQGEDRDKRQHYHNC